jgi:plasmid stabilization system protein ParE
MDDLPVVFDSRAEADVETAADWYEEQASGLGVEFIEVLDIVVDRISQQPSLYQRVSRNIRRALLARFPFAVYYQVSSTHVTVLAVLHNRRSPSTWKKRT